MKNEGLLKDLDLKKGDVVEVVSTGERDTASAYKNKKWVFDGIDRVEVKGTRSFNVIHKCPWTYRVVSRASPLPWKDLSPEGKGALLLAFHEGKKVEFWSPNTQRWGCVTTPQWFDSLIYRVKPLTIIEKVRVSWVDHSITFNKVDGVPDCSSIKMEKFDV